MYQVSATLLASFYKVNPLTRLCLADECRSRWKALRDRFIKGLLDIRLYRQFIFKSVRRETPIQTTKLPGLFTSKFGSNSSRE